MNPDPLSLISEKLKQLQPDVLRWTGGEPYQGFSNQMRQFQQQLQEMQQQAAALEAQAKAEKEKRAQTEKEKQEQAQAQPVPSPRQEDECQFPEGGEEFQQVFGKKCPPDIRTPADAIPAILDLAGISSHDVVYDLGCGDGRILIAAAQKRGAKGVGIESDPALVALAQENVWKANIEHLVRIVEGDLFQADVSPATVVYLFLGKLYNLKLREKLRSLLRPGSRVISHFFDMGDWRASTTVLVPDEHGHRHRFYAWIVRQVSERPASLIDDWNDWSDWDEWQELNG